MNNSRMTGYDKALTEIRLLSVSALRLAQEQVENSFEALLDKDINKASLVLGADLPIDNYRDSIMSNSFRLIIMQQPREKDLRWILGFYRIGQEIERIGDYACDIAELIILEPDITLPEEIFEMKDLLGQMFKRGIQLLTHEIPVTAVCLNEDDKILDDALIKLESDLSGNPTKDNSSFILLLAKILERIGDHLVNIAEMLLYVHTGDRHYIESKNQDVPV